MSPVKSWVAVSAKTRSVVPVSPVSSRVGASAMDSTTSAMTTGAVTRLRVTVDCSPPWLSQSV